jgi:nucleotidyltransferase/DNA polymerase involved in DNA repair
MRDVHCIVAKTYDAKTMGIYVGMPVWEAKKRLPHALYLSAIAVFTDKCRISSLPIALNKKYDNHTVLMPGVMPVATRKKECASVCPCMKQDDHPTRFVTPLDRAYG